MKKRILIIIPIVIVILIGIYMFIFRERPLISEGYILERTGGSVNDGTSGREIISWEAGSTLIEYNPNYLNKNIHEYTQEFLTVSTDELEVILKTAKCRLSLYNYEPYFTGDVKYKFHVVLLNGSRARHIQLYLGLNSWDSGRLINYSIQNAEDLIAALDAAASIEHFH